MNLIDIRQLSIKALNPKTHWIVKSLNLSIKKGEWVGLAGESGCGKSMTAKAILGLTSFLSNIETSGTITFENTLIKNPSKLRGREICFISQDPSTALNPLLSIKSQLQEVCRDKKRIVECLEAVRIDHPKKRLNQYPHELSGGQKQRICIAMALLSKPKLIIADEPTTALDPDIKTAILDILKDINTAKGISILHIDHDLMSLAVYADQIAIMYSGHLVEHGKTANLLSNPKHPYTKGLIQALPKPFHIPEPINGSVPSPINRPSGCPFHPRCPNKKPICSTKMPKESSSGTTYHCFNPCT